MSDGKVTLTLLTAIQQPYTMTIALLVSRMGGKVVLDHSDDLTKLLDGTHELHHTTDPATGNMTIEVISRPPRPERQRPRMNPHTGMWEGGEADDDGSGEAPT